MRTMMEIVEMQNSHLLMIFQICNSGEGRNLIAWIEKISRPAEEMTLCCSVVTQETVRMLAVDRDWSNICSSILGRSRECIPLTVEDLERNYLIIIWQDLCIFGLIFRLINEGDVCISILELEG